MTPPFGFTAETKDKFALEILSLFPEEKATILYEINEYLIKSGEKPPPQSLFPVQSEPSAANTREVARLQTFSEYWTTTGLESMRIMPRYAKILLAFAATEAAVERDFSAETKFLTPLRNQMSMETLNHSMMLHSAIRAQNKLPKATSVTPKLRLSISVEEFAKSFHCLCTNAPVMLGTRRVRSRTSHVTLFKFKFAGTITMSYGGIMRLGVTTKILDAENKIYQVTLEETVTPGGVTLPGLAVEFDPATDIWDYAQSQ